jgi:xanthine dehydrogenase accessory factor
VHPVAGVGGDAGKGGTPGMSAPTRTDLDRRALELAADGRPFVSATVVRCRQPTSVRPGDAAIVHADGRIEGFVGGHCAADTVRLHALRALETNEPVLLRIVPGPDDEPARDGAVSVENPCLSGGALEIFLEPRQPAPHLVVIGDSPVATALADLGPAVGFDVESVAEYGEGPGNGEVAAVVVAMLGHGDEVEALRAALAGPASYVGLIASRRRGAALVDALRKEGVTEDELGRLRTPAGLDLGARSHAEIALAVIAEIVADRRGVLKTPDDVAGGVRSLHSGVDEAAAPEEGGGCCHHHETRSGERAGAEHGAA